MRRIKVDVTDECIGTQEEDRNVVRDCMVARALTNAGVKNVICGSANFYYTKWWIFGGKANLPPGVKGKIIDWMCWKDADGFSRPEPFSFEVEV